MKSGQAFLGWSCVVLGILLVGSYIFSAVWPVVRRPAGQASVPQPEAGAFGVIDKLTEKAPSLAGGFTFIVLGAVLLGYLDLQFLTGVSAK